MKDQLPDHNSRICQCCERPFLAWESRYVCDECALRRSDRIGGMIVASWLFIAIIVIGGLLSACSANGGVVTESLLDHVSWVESRNNPHAVGKAGEKGAFQLKAIAVREVNRIFGTKYTHADAIPHGRDIARFYLIICESRVKNPTPERVYRKYRGLK